MIVPNSWGARSLREYNPNHEPAGSPKGGQFTSADDAYDGINDALDGSTPVPDILKRLGVEFDTITSHDGKYTAYAFSLGKERYVIEPDSVSIDKAYEWVDRQDPTNWYPEEDFNADFWAGPSPLYHATSEENADRIEKTGLAARNKTRGLTNRGTGPAVFTTIEPDEAALGTYGNVVFEIDTDAMKRDGYTPHVGMEEPLARSELKSALGHKVGLEDYSWDDGFDGLSNSTVVIYGHIPAKYLSRWIG